MSWLWKYIDVHAYHVHHTAIGCVHVRPCISVHRPLIRRKGVGITGANQRTYIHNRPNTCTCIIHTPPTARKGSHIRICKHTYRTRVLHYTCRVAYENSLYSLIRITDSCAVLREVASALYKLSAIVGSVSGQSRDGLGSVSGVATSARVQKI